MMGTMVGVIGMDVRKMGKDLFEREEEYGGKQGAVIEW